MSSRGFTLVEMAIVLVVIGLIVGGILGGQELIRVNQLTRLSSDAQRYNSAIKVFLEKYNYLPGDMPNAVKYWGRADGGTDLRANCASLTATGAGTCNGNGDGNIGILDGASQTCLEGFRAWQQMALSGVLAGNYSGVQTAGTTNFCAVNAGVNAPLTPVGNAAYMPMILTSAMGGVMSFPGNPNANVLMIGASTANRDNTNNYPFLSTQDAYSVDRKTDDGKPGQGLIQSHIQSSAWGADCSTTNDPTTAIYALSQEGIKCSLIYFP